MQYRHAALLSLAALACGGGATESAPPRAAVDAAAPEAEGTAGGELELRADATTPAELRARVEARLERPPLARIEAPRASSWVFARHPDSIEEERRPALRDRRAERGENLSSVTSDPVGRELISTMAEADAEGARLRYAP